MTQAHIIYEGIVQGVGFRYTVQRFALNLNLTGWVKNCPNGSVEALIEGPKEKIEQLCEHIESYFDGYIRDKNIQFTSALGQFQNFEITY